MKKVKLQIGFYLNTTRVSVEKIQGLEEILYSEFVTKQLEQSKGKLPVMLPFDIYEYMKEKFARYYAKGDNKKENCFILFVNGDPYCSLSQRDKIWYHRCPDCGQMTKKTPFKDHKDVFECPDCGGMFHVSRQLDEFYV